MQEFERYKKGLYKKGPPFSRWVEVLENGEKTLIPKAPYAFLRNNYTKEGREAQEKFYRRKIKQNCISKDLRATRIELTFDPEKYPLWLICENWRESRRSRDVTILADFMSAVRKYLRPKKVEYFFSIEPHKDGEHFHIHIILPHVQLTREQEKTINTYWPFGFTHFEYEGVEQALKYITKNAFDKVSPDDQIEQYREMKRRIIESRKTGKPKQPPKSRDKVLAYIREYRIKCYGPSKNFWKSLRSSESSPKPRKVENELDRVLRELKERLNK